MSKVNSKERFSDRVENYVKFRPDYPREILSVLRERTGFDSSWKVADIGSGTGISSRMFLENSNELFGVEPNAEMRGAAEKMLARYSGFHSINGSAEATTLGDASVNLIVAGQAFHWFDQAKCKTEFHRIIRLGGWCALIWNERKVAGTPFLEAYETLLLKYGTDYSAVRHENVGAAAMGGFFVPAGYESVSFPNQQLFDLNGLVGRCLSSSYAPTPGQPNHEALLDGLREIFTRYQTAGHVAFEYQTQLHIGGVDV